MRKFLSIANTAAFSITIIFNYLSNTGFFNGNTMSTVSDRYQNLFTPAGYAFSIWGLIYLGLLGFVVYQARSIAKKTKSDDVVSQVGWWFVISCAANSLWILAWLYDLTGISVVLMFILLFCLVKIILRTRMELDEVPVSKLAFLWWPFAFYSGWITVAAIANVAAYLTKVGWDGFGLSGVTWALIMILVAGVVNVYITWKRNLREFALVGVWGLTAVAAANWHKEQIVGHTAIAVSVIVLLSIGMHAYKNRKSIFNMLNPN
ncbi:tryptophan-rich sensory protein [Flavihumibacter sp. R14]|nr:tryptophan-rich sensory protein [Flavihumibacter soli]